MTRALFESNLQREAERWTGTPFIWMGNTRRGADCWGAIGGILRAVGVQAPTGDGKPYERDWFIHDRGKNRILDALLEHGLEVAEAERQPGDVVAFWSTHKKPKVTHTGLYLGGGRFVHARRGQGVGIDLLNRKVFIGPITYVRLRAVEEGVDA